MMFQPKINLIKAQIQWPSENLVNAPKSHDVTGIIAKIKLTIQGKPK